MQCPKCKQAPLLFSYNWAGIRCAECKACGFYLDEQEKENKPKPVVHHVARRCDICDKPLDKNNKVGLCQDHSYLMRNWEKGSKTLPAPLVKGKNGVWRFNPERLRHDAKQMARRARMEAEA